MHRARRGVASAGEENARHRGHSPPFLSGGVRGAVGWWAGAVGVCMASLLATALSMGTFFSTDRRRCKRRRKKRSERKGSVLIAIQSTRSAEGGVCVNVKVFRWGLNLHCKVRLQCFQFGFIRNPMYEKCFEQDPSASPNTLFHLAFKGCKKSTC